MVRVLGRILKNFKKYDQKNVYKTYFYLLQILTYDKCYYINFSSALQIYK